MMKRFVWDLESDGLLDEVQVIHCMVLHDLDTGVDHVFNNQPEGRTIADGLALLDGAELLVGHNSIAFDSEVVKKLHGLVIPWQKQRDTMVLSRLLWPERKRIDFEARKAKKAWAVAMPGQLMGRDSLESWGWRLNLHKGDYSGDSRIADEKLRYATRWAAWNPDMEAYMVQDAAVTAKLWHRCQKETPAEQSVLIETQVQYILSRQQRHGFLFDSKKAVQLYGVLAQRRAELEVEVRKVFKPLYLRDGSPKQAEMTPKRDSKVHGYSAGAAFTKVKLTEFNLTSRDHVAYWLKVHYGWEPQEFTGDGKPKVDDDVISALPYAEAAPLKAYFMVAKRIGQLAEGNKAWLKLVDPDGRLRGRVNTNGAVTGRMTHMDPNMAQVPSSKSEYGHECRELFTVPPGKKLVGADADALELRDLAGYMAIYDGGEYIKTVLEGDKSKGTDMHSVNCRALGMDPKAVIHGTETGRDIAKTWFYAFIYGAGDAKLGYVLVRNWGPEAVKAGKATRAAFLKNLPAMGKLVAAVKKAAKERGYLIGLDGRHLNVRSQHAALNTLLQAAGAVQMKKALCIADDANQAAGLTPGKEFEWVAQVHDEAQSEVDEAHAEFVGKTFVNSIRESGEFFKFRCPLDGEYKVGDNWHQTH